MDNGGEAGFYSSEQGCRKAAPHQQETKKRHHFTSTNFTAKRAEGTIWYRFLGLGYNKIAT